MASSSPPAQAAHERAINHNLIHIQGSGAEYASGTSVKDILQDEKGDTLVLQLPSADGMGFTDGMKFKISSPAPPSGIFLVTRSGPSVAAMHPLAPYTPGAWPAGVNLGELNQPLQQPIRLPYLPSGAGLAELYRSVGVADGPDETNGVHELCVNFMTFMANCSRHWGSELEMASRTDALLSCLLSTTGMELTRNRGSSAVTERSCLDAFCHYKNTPPLLLVAEKVDNIQAAVADLAQKFRWLPHYSYVGYQFVFGLAIAGNTFRFGTLTASQNLAGQFKPLVEHSTDFRGGLTGETGALNCVKSILNIGRFIASKPKPPVMQHAFALVFHSGNKHMIIQSAYVQKQYKPVLTVDKKRMTEFYQNCRDVPQLERSTVHDNRAGQVTFRLTPVGVEYPHCFPQSLAEVKTCLRDMLSALDGCHRLGWFVVDVRWTNVVFCDGHWYIIDAAEHAQKQRVGAAAPEIDPGSINLRPDPATGATPIVASVDVDMRQLAYMFDGAEAGVQGILNSDPNGAQFLSTLPHLTAANALNHAFLQ